MTSWDIIIPLRGGGSGAKSRLVGENASGGLGRALAFAFACDVVDVVNAHPDVAHVIVLTSHEATAAAFTENGVETVLDLESGNLNGSIAALSKNLRLAHPRNNQAVLVADLPSLNLDDFSTILTQATDFPRSVLSDKDQTGTCFLACHSPLYLEPFFGIDSYRLHRDAGFTPLSSDVCPSIWSDVDTPEDLQTALEMGVGPHTAKILAHLEQIHISDFRQ